MAMYNWNGENEVTATGAVDITAKSAIGNAWTMHAQGGSNVVKGNNVEIAASSTDGQARGMVADSGGSNKVTATNGDVTVAATSTNGQARGMDAFVNNARNEVAGNNVAISADGALLTFGIRANDSGTNTVTASTDLSINATSTRNNAVGIGAYNAGMNTVSGENISVTAEGNTGACALEVSGGGNNNVTATGAVDITATSSNGPAIALYGGNVSGAKNTVKGESITITATVGQSDRDPTYLAATAMSSWGGENEVTATGGDVVITATSEYGAYGMVSGDAGKNTVNGERVTITATADGSNVLGMNAASEGTNTINGVTVIIEAKTGTLGHAYAMWAAHNGTNTINILSTSEKDGEVILTGEVHADTGGKNVINGGAGKDTITINGALSGIGTNTIDAGDGDDTIILNGAVYGSLNIIAGEGHDTLILMAPTVAEFNSYYQAWLEGVFGGVIEDLEAIEIRVDSATDLAALKWLADDWAGDLKVYVDGEEVENPFGSGISPASGSILDLTGQDIPESAIRAEQAATQMTYTIALAAAGLLVNPADMAIGESLSFKLEMNGMTSDQIAEAVLQLGAAEYVSAIPGDGYIEVTLDGNYIPANNDLTFKLALGSYTDGLVGVGIGEDIVEYNVVTPVAVDEGILVGTNGNDIIVADEGIDVIYGLEGDDVIYAGAGDHTIYGGDGHDTFVYDMDSLEGKIGGDIIMDFRINDKSSSDVLDISELLTVLGHSAGDDSLKGLLAGGYLNFTVRDDGSGNAVLVLGVDKDGGGANMQTLATIHTDASYASFSDPNDLLVQMNEFNQIKFI
jgi:Ca2+-binding RTX toxin-like protein